MFLENVRQKGHTRFFYEGSPKADWMPFELTTNISAEV